MTLQYKYINILLFLKKQNKTIKLAAFSATVRINPGGGGTSVPLFPFTYSSWPVLRAHAERGMRGLFLQV